MYQLVYGIYKWHYIILYVSISLWITPLFASVQWACSSHTVPYQRFTHDADYIAFTKKNKRLKYRVCTQGGGVKYYIVHMRE